MSRRKFRKEIFPEAVGYLFFLRSSPWSTFLKSRYNNIIQPKQCCLECSITHASDTGHFKASDYTITEIRCAPRWASHLVPLCPLHPIPYIYSPCSLLSLPPLLTLCFLFLLFPIFSMLWCGFVAAAMLCCRCYK